MFEKDIRCRAKIRNMEVFNRVLTYVVNNFGAATNAGNVADHFRDVERVPVRRETIARYLGIMERAKLVCKCTRFDMKSRRSLGAQEKYYLADVGIYCARSTDNRLNYGPALENMLYTYLRARDYQVSVGKIGKLECDFIARKGGDYAYVQVAMTIADRAVEEREYRPFSRIRDAYPRYLFTLDPLLQRRDGVRHLNLLDFMSAGGGLAGEAPAPVRAVGVSADAGRQKSAETGRGEPSPAKEAIVEHLARHGLSRRADLEQATGLGTSRVNDLLRELVAEGRVVAEGATRSRRYRLAAR